MKIAKSRVKYH